eukprot:659323_1
MKQFKRFSNACVCLWILLLLCIDYGTAVGFNVVNDDVLRSVSSWVPNSNRANFQLVHTRWRDLGEDIYHYQRDVDEIKRILCDTADLSNQNAWNYSTQIRTIIQEHRNDWVFRERFGKYLPIILTCINSKRLYSQSTGWLLSALNINLPWIIARFHTRPSIAQGIGLSSSQENELEFFCVFC